ncbi:threonine-phosphate decarboxylase CobD [Planktothrix sp. FACHB-1365]|uniref:threonine-phosphate decarboxylase CobD n=1 Tax=Planktothrix sp. FACHB-1365 TaxID=2692855 RepID=UPI0016882E31|nr:threonine-phosphate decarboxylase CobD [Planktothrix sp. FACHB-1365]MBD2485151.1 threonine-phosphate decarboxylase [Planktothrix sp. FACHB-1365]
MEATHSPQHGGNLIWAATVADCSPSDILDFSASINPWGPPLSALSAIHRHLNDLNAYPNPDYGELRAAIAVAVNDAMAHESLEVDWILPGNGVAELLTWAGRELAQLDATYLLTPAFGDYKRTLNAFDGTVIECPLSMASIESEFSLPQPSNSRSGLLINNPHNPTGKLFSAQGLLELLEQFALVVVDEAFMDFLLPRQQQSLMSWVKEFENLVILRSLTKFYSLPGLRLGYAIAHPQRLKKWQGWRDPWPVNSLAVAAGIAVLQDTEFQEQTWRWLEETRPKLYQDLANIPGLKPFKSVANFILVESDYSVSQLQLKLLKNHQILIRDCLSFPSLGDRYFRVAVKTEAQNQRLIQALTTVCLEEN